jgi:hypothetical protein
MTCWATRLAVLACLLGMPLGASAQSPTSPVATPSEQLLKAEELDALVAPIALHPDNLLAEILMASTYPLEVVQADRWVTENKNLKGDQLKAAVQKQGWDDSVKTLAATPDVLAMMSKQLDWTRKLGDAVLAQQPDVMDAIQRLRSRAQANNKLMTTREQNVSVRQEQSKQVIVIEPAVPDTMYVPYYEPAEVYGSWPYPDYPPYYWPPAGYWRPWLSPMPVLGTGIAFAAGIAAGAAWWGAGANWGNNNITINRGGNINNIGNNWQHRPEHRQGVRYNNASVQQKFGNNNIRGGSQNRMDYRGKGGNQVLNPDRPGTGAKGGPGAGAKAGPGAGAKGPSVGSKKSGPGAGAKGPTAGGKKTGNKAAARSGSGARPSAATGGPRRDNALGNINSGRAAHAQSMRGRASAGNMARAPGAGRGGAGISRGGGGRGGGGRRSDIELKHDIALLGWLQNGLGFYRFSYNGSATAYVGVMAQEVQAVMPEVVVRGQDGYLRVYYDKLGLKLQTYDGWVASGARLPAILPAAAPPDGTRQRIN